MLSTMQTLPGSSICLLSLGCLNPYMELQRERNQYPRTGMSMLGSGGRGNIQGMEDLSGLASVPFVMWWSWCIAVSSKWCCPHAFMSFIFQSWFRTNVTTFVLRYISISTVGATHIICVLGSKNMMHALFPDVTDGANLMGYRSWPEPVSVTRDRSNLQTLPMITKCYHHFLYWVDSIGF